MFARVFALLPLAVLASASVLGARGDSQCNSGATTCCNSAGDEQYSQLLGSGLLNLVSGVVAQANVGLQCTSIVGNACSNSQVCCNNDNFDGGDQTGLLELLGLGPINLNCNSIVL